MKAVIFDMDGTMINNMMVHHRAWQKILAKYGLEMTLEQVHQEIHGVNTEILEQLFGDKYTEEERQQIADEKEATYQNTYRNEIKLVDGLSGFLDKLDSHGIPIALASAAPAGNVEFVLESLNLHGRFASVLHAGDVSRGKPDPEIYLSTAENLNLKPEDCMVFEDSPTGARAARAAGCRLVIVTTTHNPEEFEGISGIEAFISDFTDDYIGVLTMMTST